MNGVLVDYEDDGFAWVYRSCFHREDGPAIEYADGSKEWYIHGKCHREDGPAIEEVDGSKAWFIHGKYISTWKEYHELTTLSPELQVIVKLRYGEQLK